MKSYCFLISCLLFLGLTRFSSSVAQQDSILKIHSGIYKSFNKPFHLSDDDLRRIYSVMEEASNKLPVQCKVVFYVRREDDRFYETTNIEDVFNDPNIEGREICRVVVEIRIIEPGKVRDPWESPYYAYVSFDTKSSDKAFLSINYEDRTWALDLADKIEPLITKTNRISEFPRWVIDLLLLSIIMLLYTLERTFEKGYKHFEVEFVVIRILLILSIVAVLFDMTTFIGSWSVSRIMYLIRIDSAMLWGQVGEKVIQKEHLHDKVWWGVIITFIVSISANLFTHFSFNKKSLIHLRMKSNQ